MNRKNHLVTKSSGNIYSRLQSKKMNKEVTIYDIASALNISASTVSRALNNATSVRDETKSRIRTKATEMGYRQNVYAKNLKKRKPKIIKIVVSDINDAAVLDALAAIGKIAGESGCQLIIRESRQAFLL